MDLDAFKRNGFVMAAFRHPAHQELVNGTRGLSTSGSIGRTREARSYTSPFRLRSSVDYASLSAVQERP